MANLILHKNEVGGYAYNDAQTLILQINRVLEQQLYEDSTDGMKGLTSKIPNALTKYKSNVSIKKRDVLSQSKAQAKAASSDANTVAPEITTNADAHEEAHRQNEFRLAAIGIKEAIAKGITSLVGEAITNPILRTADGSDFKNVDEYQLHQLITAITEGAERPEAGNIRRQYVSIAGTVFDWRETAATNMERLAALAAKSVGYGVRVHHDLRAVVILVNVEWAAQQTWGQEIGIAHREMKTKYKYNHVHDADSIKVMMKLLAVADEARDRRRAKAPGELADMVSQGMERLQQLVHQRPQSSIYTSDSSETSEGGAYAATTSDSSDEGASRASRRGRKKKKETKRGRRRETMSPSTSRSPSCPPPPTPRHQTPFQHQTEGEAGRQKIQPH
jgi:ElaB/YqjD/DUF883 family membrane-anchored ribosome-binding protein